MRTATIQASSAASGRTSYEVSCRRVRENRTGRDTDRRCSDPLERQPTSHRRQTSRAPGRRRAAESTRSPGGPFRRTDAERLREAPGTQSTQSILLGNNCSRIPPPPSVCLYYLNSLPSSQCAAGGSLTTRYSNSLLNSSFERPAVAASLASSCASWKSSFLSRIM